MLSVQSSRRITFLAAVVLLTVQFVVNHAASADEYPAKPITLVIPFSAGGSHDLNARAFTGLMSEYLGQPMIVKLTPGAGGQKGARYVADSKPDGYTLLFGHNLIDQLQPHTEELGYDPLRAFRAVWKLNDTVPVIYVRADSRFREFGQLLSFGLARPGELVFPNSGKWGFSFTVGALMMAETGLRLNMVPYKGGGPVKSAILSGDGDFASAPYGSIRALHDAGEVRVLAVVAGERLASLPDTPAFGELGHPYQGAIMERVVLAPRGTPEDRIRVLSRAFSRLYQDQRFLQIMNKMEENTRFMDGSDYEKVRRRQTKMYGKLVHRILGDSGE